MHPILLIMLLTAPPPPAANEISCGHGKKLKRTPAGIVLTQGRRALTAPTPLRHTVISCAWHNKHTLLTVTGERLMSLFSLKRGKLIPLTRVFAPSHETAENVERFDPVSGELYRVITSAAPCHAGEVRSFRKRFNARRGQFEAVPGSSTRLPPGLKAITVKPGPLPGTHKGTIVPFSVTGASSWKGDTTTGDFEPPALPQLTDLKPRTAWISGSQLGPGDYLVLSRPRLPYPLQGIRIFPGNYNSPESLKSHRRLKKFALINEHGEGYTITVPKDPVALPGSHTRPFHVAFPKPLRGNCVTLVFLSWYSSSPADPAALSEVTLFSSLDFEKDPVATIIRDFNKEKLGYSSASRLMGQLSDQALLTALTADTSADVRRMLLSTAVQRKSRRFLPHLLSSLSHARGAYLTQLRVRLAVPEAMNSLKQMVLNTKMDRTLRREALHIYLAGGLPDLLLLKRVTGPGTRKDYHTRKLIERQVSREHWRPLMERGCALPDIHKRAGLLWLFARWTRQDPSLRSTLSGCLSKGPGKSFAQRMRFLFAAEQTRDAAHLKAVTALFDSDPRTPVKERAMLAASHLPGGLSLARKALKSEDPGIVAAAVSVLGTRPLPQKLLTSFTSSIPFVSEAISRYLIATCDKRALPVVLKSLRSSTHWPMALHIVEKCRFTSARGILRKLFTHKKEPSHRARFALALARFGDTERLASIKALYGAYRKQAVKEGGSSRHIYAAASLLQALAEFNSPALDPWFLKLATQAQPRIIHRALTHILSKRCPAQLKKVKLFTGSRDALRGVLMIRKRCGL